MKNNALKNILLIMTLGLLSLVAAAQPPVARVENVANDYFGRKINDPYRWMENDKSPEFAAFLKSQADYAGARLDRLPLRKELLERLARLDSDAPPNISAIERTDAGNQYLYLKQPPDAQTAKLYRRAGLNGEEELLIDPDKFKTATENYAISYFVPSPDAKYIVYAIAANGSDRKSRS